MNVMGLQSKCQQVKMSTAIAFLTHAAGVISIDFVIYKRVLQCSGVLQCVLHIISSMSAFECMYVHVSHSGRWPRASAMLPTPYKAAETD